MNEKVFFYFALTLVIFSGVIQLASYSDAYLRYAYTLVLTGETNYQESIFVELNEGDFLMVFISGDPARVLINGSEQYSLIAKSSGYYEIKIISSLERISVVNVEIFIGRYAPSFPLLFILIPAIFLCILSIKFLKSLRRTVPYIIEIRKSWEVIISLLYMIIYATFMLLEVSRILLPEVAMIVVFFSPFLTLFPILCTRVNSFIRRNVIKFSVIAIYSLPFIFLLQRFFLPFIAYQWRYCESIREILTSELSIPGIINDIVILTIIEASNLYFLYDSFLWIERREKRATYDETLLTAIVNKELNRFFSLLREKNIYASAVLYLMVKENIECNKRIFTLHELLREYPDILSKKVYDSNIYALLDSLPFIKVSAGKVRNITLDVSDEFYKVIKSHFTPELWKEAGIGTLKEWKKRYGHKLTEK